MTGAWQEAQFRLANGFTINLRHDARATEAAALLQVATGSDAEPTARPGLAHLLEHVLFTGSAAYQQRQRLISWIPAQGGRLNATTRSDRTAFFFAVDPSKLEPGLARLTDMLTAPLWDLAALEQEISVIDAEYRLLAADPDSLCEAAQLSLFEGEPALRRFQVGNRAVFGDDLPSLRQALREFHQHYYHAGNMTLWLQGPQSLAELRDLAGRYGAGLPEARAADAAAPLRLTARGDARLCVEGPPRLRLSFALNGWQESDAGWFDVLRVLLCDEARGSLMAWLREREWCDGVRLINSWRGTDAAIAAVEFTLVRADPVLGVQAERALLYWLEQLSMLSSQQLQHYARLARRRFIGQTPLDQLRDRAFDAPARQADDTGAWQRCLSHFRPEDMSRLWISEQGTGATVRCRGFDVRLVPFTPPSVAPGPAPASCFHSGSPVFAASPALPSGSVRLRHIPADEAAVLLLYPAPDSDFTNVQGHILQEALRMPAADLAHGGGELRFERLQGVWLLQLRADDELMLSALAEICARLRALPDAIIRQGQRARRHELKREQGQIPVRRLLSQLPDWLSAAPAGNDSDRLADTAWQGTLYGGTGGLHHGLSRMLSCFPGVFTAPAPPAAAFVSAATIPVFAGTPDAARHTLTQIGGDNAFVLFSPPPAADIDTQLAWRLLALIYQPLFFQQLRVEMNIGYVASCSFHETAWRAGILFAAQSPHLNGDELHQLTLTFLSQQDQELAQMPEALLAERRATLRRILTRRDPNGFSRARQACLTASQALATPQAQARLEQMDREALRRWHRIFTDAARRHTGTLIAMTLDSRNCYT